MIDVSKLKDSDYGRWVRYKDASWARIKAWDDRYIYTVSIGVLIQDAISWELGSVCRDNPQDLTFCKEPTEFFRYRENFKGKREYKKPVYEPIQILIYPQLTDKFHYCNTQYSQDFDIKFDSTDHFSFHCHECKVKAEVTRVGRRDFKEPTVYFHLTCPKCGKSGQRKIYLEES